MRLRITITSEIEVTDLSHYDATTLEEAAANQQKWIDNGDHDPLDFMDWDEASIKVEPVK
jgi:hypothetical protein